MAPAPPAQLIVFVKAPRVGSVKTRLGEVLGPEGACAAYHELVTALLRNIGSLDSVQLRFTPDTARSEIALWLRAGWQAEPQGEGDLGHRLARAFADSFARGFVRVVIIGSDCPDITAADVTAAAHALDTHDLVIGPATDGGYWLVALRANQPELFRHMPWSTPELLAETLGRAKSIGLRVSMLRILSDIDTAEDWARWSHTRPPENAR